MTPSNGSVSESNIARSKGSRRVKLVLAMITWPLRAFVILMFILCIPCVLSVAGLTHPNAPCLGMHGPQVFVVLAAYLLAWAFAIPAAIRVWYAVRDRRGLGLGLGLWTLTLALSIASMHMGLFVD